MATIDFEPEAPQIDFEPSRIDFTPETPVEGDASRVAKMAAATRHTLGVVGRAIAARDFAVAGANFETLPGAPEAVATDESGRPLDPRGRNPAQLNPAWEGTRLKEHTGLAPLMTPLVPLRKAFSQGEQLSYLATQQPEGAARETLAMAGGIVSGTEDVVGGAMEFLTSPVGLATLGLGTAPAALRAISSATFTADMLSHTPEAYEAYLTAKTPPEKARALVAGLGNLAMAGVAGSHAYGQARAAITKPKTPLEQVAPLTAEAVAKVPNETKAPDPLISPEPIKQSEVAPSELPKGIAPLRKMLFEGMGESMNDFTRTSSREVLVSKWRIASKLLSEIHEEIATRKNLGENEKDLFGIRYDIDGIRGVLEHELMVRGAQERQTPLTTAAVESVKVPETPTAKPEGERALTSEPVANSRLAADAPIAEPYSDKFSVSLQVNTTKPSVSDASVIASLPEALRASVDSVRRFEGEAVPTNKAASIPGRVQIVFKDKASAQAAVDYFKTPASPIAKVQAEVSKVASENPFDTSVTSARLTELDTHKPRPTDKLYGQSGGTPDLRAENDAKLRKWTSERAKAVREHRALVEQSNEWIRQNPTEPALTSEPQGAIATPGPTLQPERRFATRLPPKSQRQIITDIAQGLKLPIRFGRLRTNRFAGYFLKLQNLIGSKRANDIPIVSHEAGHKLDATFGFANDPALRVELERLGDPAAFAGSRSSWTKSKSIKYKRGEGVAEFVRFYLTDPAAAAQHAPNMARAFEAALDSNKDFGDTMRQAQSDIQTWRNAEPQARLRSHISVGGNPNKTPYTVSQLTRDLVDDLHFLRLAANDAKAGGTDLAPSQNPYTLARNLRGSYGMADSFIRSGVADFKTKEVTLGTSLEDALTPVSGRIADFRDWMVAKQAKELHAQGKETGLVDSDVQFTVTKFDKDADFQKAFTAVKAWEDSLLQYAVDSTFTTKDGAAAMRKMYQDYVPLHRVFEVGAGEAPAIEGAGTGRGLNVGKPGSLKTRTGSARDIVDPLETMVRNAYAIITASEKHAINIAVADMARLPDMGKWVEHIATPKERVQVGVEKLREQLENEGADMTAVPDDVMLQFFQNSGKAPFGENVIKVVRDGKPEFYRLKRELFETFNALDLEDSGTLVRMLSAPSQVLRAGVVLDPSFALANVMRDAFTSSIVSRHGLLPFEATFRGVAAMLKSPKLVAEWEAAGGKNAIEANYFDRQKLQKFLAEKITKDLTPTERALIAVKSPLQALRWLTSLGEEATRIGEYQKAFEDFRKGGMSEGDARRQAAFESRDRQDFAKGGAKTKIPRRLAAFWNAGIQGNVRLAQAFRERPMQTTMKGLAYITIPKLIEQALNWNDDDYWDRPQWERDLFFLIPAGKGEDGHTRFIRIPTPFEAGVIFGTFPGRILQSIRESSAENMKTFPAVLAKQTIPNPTPQFALTIFEDFMVGKRGYDVYRGRQIVPESIAQLPADMQWTEQTSLAARKLGAALGFPPVKIDHIINQTTGGLGKQVTHQIVDRAISVATGDERTAKGIVPGGRFATTPAAVSSQAIDDFYTTLDRVKTAAEGQKKGRDDELARWKPMFTAREAQISQLRRAMRQTKDEAQKDAIAEHILALARETMKEFRKAKKETQP